MEVEENTFETETWQDEYLKTWQKLPLGLRRHLARLAPQEAFQPQLEAGVCIIMGVSGVGHAVFSIV